MGCITVLIKMISWALYKVTIDLALHTLHNQHRSISDHVYKVDNTHDNNTSHTPSEDTDQLWHPPNRTRAFAFHVKKFKPSDIQLVEINDIDHILSEQCPG